MQYNYMGSWPSFQVPYISWLPYITRWMSQASPQSAGPPVLYKDGDPLNPANFRPLALSSCIGKPFHQIKADRMSEYMVKNNYIELTIQKAFIAGINGCVEHIQVLQ